MTLEEIRHSEKVWLTPARRVLLHAAGRFLQLWEA